MWSQDSDIELKIAALGASACIDLFGAYGLTLELGQTARMQTSERLLSGSIGFVGRRLRGSCLLAAGEKPLSLTCPEKDGALRDWVGELTNQFVGRLKTKLLSRDIEVFVTTPIVLAGVHIEPLPRSRMEPFVFKSSAGEVMAWIEVETEEAFVFGSERPTESGIEGDILVL